MTQSNPKVVLLAGANGAGKSTAAPKLLHQSMHIEEFVNADVIARGLSAFAPDRAAIRAGRVMLQRLDELASSRVNFAFETTLSGRSYAVWLERLITTGYSFKLFYLWIPSPEFAVARVAERVGKGGHSIPENTIRRRYFAGLRNLIELYIPLASEWQVIDNSSSDHAKVVALGSGTSLTTVLDEKIWKELYDSA